MVGYLVEALTWTTYAFSGGHGGRRSYGGGDDGGIVSAPEINSIAVVGGLAAAGVLAALLRERFKR